MTKFLRLVFAITIATALHFAANAQQLVIASGTVQIVTTAGTKTVINGGGITFRGTSKWVGTADSIYVIKTTAGGTEGWIDSTTAGAMDAASTGHVFFRGNNRQSFYGKTRFYDFTLRNTVGDTLLSSCEVMRNLHLDTGLVYTRSGYGLDSLLVSNMTSAAITSTSNYKKSWVHGRLSRTANLTGAANEYLFPIGKLKLIDSLYAPVKLDKFNSTPNTYTAEYFPTLPYDNTNIKLPIDHVSYVENWTIDAVTPTGPDGYAAVSLSWRTYSKVSSDPVQRLNLLVAQYVANPGYAWWKLGPPGPYIVTDLPDSSFGYVKHPAYLGTFAPLDRRYTLATSSSTNPLPVKLIYFTAIADGSKVRLNWESANEQETVKYEIEKSLTATNFVKIGTVLSRQLSQAAYVDFDNSPAMGWNYYRLKMIDKFGNFTYSPVRPVKFEKGLEQVNIFPVPATTVLNIQLPSSYVNKVQLQVFGIDGKFISLMKPTSNMIVLNVKPLAAATYFLIITKDDGSKETYRFVKQ